MGDKGIKAIAVRGTKDINLARPAEFMELCNDVLKYIKFRERESDPERDAHPGRARVAAGDGSLDEKWHTENFMWGNARVRRKDFWNKEVEEKWKETQETRADAADKLLQLPDEMRGHDLRPRNLHLHDEMLLEAYLYDGGLFRPGFRVSRSPSGPRSMAWTDSRPRRSWPSPLSSRKPAS